MRASEERHGLFIRPSRSHTRGSHSLLRTSLLILMMILVSADVVSTPALAFTTQTWNTTALFNAGTKASTGTATDTCENVTANGLALNNSGNFQGVGLTTGTSTCATGAWGVNPLKQNASYDMQTWASSKSQDFSGNSNSLFGFGVTNTTGKFGGSLGFNGISQYLQTDTGHPMNLGPNTGSFCVWLKPAPYIVGGIEDAVRHEFLSASSRGGYYLEYRGDAGSIWNVNFQNTAGIQFGNSYTKTQVPVGLWSFICGTLDGTNVRTYLNGTQTGGAIAFSGTLSFGRSLIVGAYGVTGGARQRFFNGSIDEVQVYSRALLAGEITKLYTDGRSSFLSSGSWTSPSVAFTTTPASVTLTFSGGTASNRPSRLRFLDSASSAVVFDTLIPSGLASPIQIPVNLTFNPSSWKVKLDMIGSGSGTATFSSILVTLGAAPLFQSTDMLFIVFLVLFFILPIVGFWKEIYVLVMIGGVVGFVFGWWLFTQTNYPIMAFVIWFLAAFFFIGGTLLGLSSGSVVGD